jgi:CcmD family protein
MIYLTAAYVIFWAVTFLVVIRMTLRQKELQREIESLKRALEERAAREKTDAEARRPEAEQ